MGKENEESNTEFPILPKELWVSHIIPALEMRQDALLCFSGTCKALKEVTTVEKGLFAEHASANGALGVLKWGIESGCPWNTRIYPAAAGGGHLDILMWGVETKSQRGSLVAISQS